MGDAPGRVVSGQQKNLNSFTVVQDDVSSGFACCRSNNPSRPQSDDALRELP
jgi:hypothetical protein